MLRSAVPLNSTFSGGVAVGIGAVLFSAPGLIVAMRYGWAGAVVALIVCALAYFTLKTAWAKFGPTKQADEHPAFWWLGAFVGGILSLGLFFIGLCL
jgi:hypothetical protein